MTPHKEDYLKELYKLGGNEHLVANKEIAKNLSVAPSSVTEMLGKLQKEGYIIYEPYKGSILTPKGLESSITLLRGHRLWEVFLIRHLGYSWSEAHEDAELLEHITPHRLTKRLDKFLNYPNYCPHGSAIPREDGTIINLDLYPLTDISIDQTVIIRKVSEEFELLDYLQEKGIHMGAPIVIREKEAYEGPLTLLYEGSTIQLSHKAASKIFVEIM